MYFKLFIFAICAAYCSASGGAAHGGGGASLSVEGESETVKILVPGKKITLKCNVTDVFWFKDDKSVDSDDHLSAFANGTLVITNTTKEDVGVYKCDKGEDIFTEFKVVMLSYSRLPKSTTAISGDTLSITCDVTGSPTPVVSWSKDGEDVVASDRIELSNKNTSDTPSPMGSTLTIKEVTEEDRGLYTCTFDNSDGDRMFTTSTTVRVKSLYAALWPFLGIVAEVVLLCCIILFYERRRSNADFEEGDDTSKTGR